MKILHISDLHLGKRVFEFSMLKDQEHVLKEILNIIDHEKPNAILIAGDIYDKSIPSAEAVALFDDFLTQLSYCHCSVHVISGNHDSPERLNFGSRIMANRNIYITGTFQGRLQKEVLTDEYGTINIFSMPYLKPAMVRPFFDDQEIASYYDGIKMVIENEKINGEERNILLAHQFITGNGIPPETCESETLSIGGLDNVDARVFDIFDYVALGHLHGAQRVLRDSIRYSGSILKYSFSEMHHKKTVAMIEIKEKGELFIDLIPLKPLRDLREIKGPMEELLKPEIYLQGNQEDYLSVILTDDDIILDPIGKLRQVYPNIMRLGFDNRRTRSQGSISEISTEVIQEKTVEELFESFFETQHGIEMSEEQRSIISNIVNKEFGGDI